MNNWFDVDKEGLARILKRRGLEFVAFELISNAWDSKATSVDILLEPVPNKRLAKMIVTDNDPEGFKDITHAYTMFADSLRRDDPEARGRFNLGEKLVLAIATEATIVTKTAAFKFDTQGRHTIRARSGVGSQIEIIFPATHKEIDDILKAINTVIPPIPTTINRQSLQIKVPTTTFPASLETILPDDNGILKPHIRKTVVEVYQTGGILYELGIPVVETGDTYSYNVMQKVPVNMDRDNVPPKFLRTLRVMALNVLHDKLDSEDCNKTWVRDALTDKRVTPEAVKSTVLQRFGNKVVSYDPSDKEANSLAVSKGYVVVHGKQLSSDEWGNVRKAEAIKPAGQVTPSPKPYSANGKPLTTIPETEWTFGMRYMADYSKLLFKKLIGRNIRVIITNQFGWGFSATYGNGELTLNKASLGNSWFEPIITDEKVALLIHEAGHEYELDHLSSKYHEALCALGAKMRHLGNLS